MRGRRLALAVVVVAALGREASSDPIYHLRSPSELVTEKGSRLALPPGYFLDENTWADRDAELKAAQEARVRLAAENASMRKSLSEGGSVRGYLITLVVGAALGIAGLLTLK